MDLSLTHMLSRRTRLVLFSLLALLTPPALVAQTDVPSGYFPGYISVIAGGGTGQVPGLALSISLGLPFAMAVDSHANIYFTGQNGGPVLMLYSGDGYVPPILASALAAQAIAHPNAGYIYNVGGAATTYSLQDGGLLIDSTFGIVTGLTVDTSDNLYIADEGDSVVWRVNNSTGGDGTIHLLAGQIGVPSSGPGIGDMGAATNATLNYPTDARMDLAGNVYITDSGNQVVRVVYGGGAAPAALTAENVTLSPTQDKGKIYTIAGTVESYCSGATQCGNGGPATSAAFGFLSDSTEDAAGNVFITDGLPNDVGAQLVWVLYAADPMPPILSTVPSQFTPLQKGHIYEVAGQEFTACAAAPCGDGGLALSATLNAPGWVEVDSSGNIYIDDLSDNSIRKIDYSGYISDVAGAEDPGTPATTGFQSGLATTVYFDTPGTFAFDAHQNLYITDTGNNFIWQAAPQLSQTINFNALTDVTYGAVHSITLDATATSGLPVSYSVSGPATLNGSTLNITGGGTITVTASQAGGTQTVNGTSTLYQAAPNKTQTLTVNPATITVTATASEVYCAINTICQPIPQPSFAPDPSGVFTGTPGYGYPAAGTDVGTYSLPVSIGSLALVPAYQHDYTFAFVPGTITITGSTNQTITFPPLATITYGATQTVALAATASSGLPISYTLSGSAASLSGSTLTILGAGSVTVTANQAGNNTYIGATSKSQTLTINPAPLTITAPTFTLTYGSPVAYPAPVISGFVGSDTQASVISGSPIYSTTAPTNPPVGTYTVSIVGQGSLMASANYVLPAAYGQGTLTIVGDPQTISFNPLFNITYGSVIQPPTAFASSSLPVTFTLTGPAYFTNGSGGQPVGTTIITNPGAGQNAVYYNPTGVGTVTITATQAGNAQYAAAPPVTQTFTVAPASLYVTVTPQNSEREYGAPNGIYSFTLGNSEGPGSPGAFVGNDSDVPSVITGTPVITTAATQDSPPGVYPITISTGSLQAANYTFVFVPGTLTILPAGSYTITSSPASLTIPAGESRQASITVTPVNLYQGTVTLSCGQLPANVTCIFSPSTFTFTGATNAAGNAAFATQGTLTINTVGGETVVGAIAPTSSPVERASLLLLPATIAGLLVSFRRRQLAKYSACRQICLIIALAIGALGLSSCGSSSKSSTGAIAAPGTANVVITGVGTTADGTGSVSSSMTLSVTVQ